MYPEFQLTVIVPAFNEVDNLARVSESNHWNPPSIVAGDLKPLELPPES